MGYDADLVVIGGGSGGVRCARMSAAMGARVVLVESGRLGGTCVNVGCVPKKLMTFGAGYGDGFAEAHAYGWNIEGHPSLDWGRMMANKDREIARLNSVYDRILTSPGVDIRRGHGRIVGPHAVDVGGTVVTTEHILIATGGRPFVPTGDGMEHANTSDAVFELQDLPRRIAVIGGGYIGVELASIFRGYGAEVTLLVRGETLLRSFDHDIRHMVADQLAERGIALHHYAPIRGIERLEDGTFRVGFGDEGQVDVDFVLCACGRVPNTQGLGLDDVGVEVDPRGQVVVDDTFHTNIPSILAVGDVVGRMQLTPVALEEGMTVARNLFGGGEPRSVDYDHIATAVFCTPPVGTVGLTEEDVRAAGGDPLIFRSRFTPMKHTLSGRSEKAMLKLVVDRDTDRVLGCHMVGAHAGEIIQGFAVALKCGATKAQFDATVGIHPTAAEEFVTMRTPVNP